MNNTFSKAIIWGFIALVLFMVFKQVETHSQTPPRRLLIRISSMRLIPAGSSR